MSAALKDIVEELQKLETAKGGGNKERARTLTSKLKLHIMKDHAKAGPQARGTGGSQEANLAVQGLEIGCILCIRAGDMQSFERNFAQLAPYYAYKKSSKKDPPSSSSSSYTTVVGLNLMRLLVAKKIPEFHSALELISLEDRKNPNVAFPLSLEEYLTEGNYAKFFQYELTKCPNEDFAVFMKPLFRAAREEIVACCASAYSELTFEDMKHLMGLNDREKGAEEVLAYVSKRDDCAIDRKKQCVRFLKKNESDEKRSKADISPWELAKQNLMYATELERIV
eukprot:g2757.t1